MIAGVLLGLVGLAVLLLCAIVVTNFVVEYQRILARQRELARPKVNPAAIQKLEHKLGFVDVFHKRDGCMLCAADARERADWERYAAVQASLCDDCEQTVTSVVGVWPVRVETTTPCKWHQEHPGQPKPVGACRCKPVTDPRVQPGWVESTHCPIHGPARNKR